jgi:peptide/nickel transport system substrate-binding protein
MVQDPDQMGQDATEASEVPNAPLTRRQLVGAAAALGAAGLLAPHQVAAEPVPTAGTFQANRNQDELTTLTIAFYGSPSDLDPQLANDYRSVFPVMAIYEGLLALKGEKTDEYEGRLAESWEANADQSVWTFKLRDGVTFHDGSPCDAEAVRRSFERYVKVGYGSGLDWTRFVPDPSAITAPDPKTVVFDLGRPQPLFEAAIAASYGVYVVNVPVMEEHAVDDDGGRAWAQSNAEGTGTGPYKLAQFEPGDLMILEKNEAWWGGPDEPFFDRVIIRVVPENSTRRQLLEAGEVDIIDALTADDWDALKENPAITVQSSPSTNVQYFYLTVAGPLASAEARQAMVLAFPYQEVIDGVLRGYATQPAGFVAESLNGFNPETFKPVTDLDQARELFAAAGIGEGTTLELALEPGTEHAILAAQLFQANLAELGITLNITEIETSSYIGLLYGETPVEERPNLMYWGWWPSYNDAWSQLNALAGCEMTGAVGGANLGGYCNEQVQELLDAAFAATDEATYMETIGDAQQIVARDDPPAIFFSQPDTTVGHRAEITGIVLNPINVGTYYLHTVRRE